MTHAVMRMNSRNVMLTLKGYVLYVKDPEYTNPQRKLPFGVTKMWLEAVVAQHCDCTKCHWIVCLKMLDVMFCALCLNKNFFFFFFEICVQVSSPRLTFHVSPNNSLGSSGPPSSHSHGAQVTLICL